MTVADNVLKSLKFYLINIEELNRRFLERPRPKSVLREETQHGEHEEHRRVRRIERSALLVEAQANHANLPEMSVHPCHHHRYPVRIDVSQILLHRVHVLTTSITICVTPANRIQDSNNLARFLRRFEAEKSPFECHNTFYLSRNLSSSRSLKTANWRAPLREYLTKTEKDDEEIRRTKDRGRTYR